MGDRMHLILWGYADHTADGLERCTPTPRYQRTSLLSGASSSAMITVGTLVTVVDDDESVRESLPDLLTELGFTARAFASAEEFLESDSLGETQCLLLDIAMPGMSGIELQRQLMLRGQRIPIVFITARTEDSVRRDLLKRGAIECLFKPFSEQELRTALAVALRREV